jgi:hypothetical protein
MDCQSGEKQKPIIQGGFMAREYFQTDFILDNLLKKMAPWHSKIGGPGFPEKFLWEPSSFSPT